MSHDKIRAEARKRMAETGEPYATARREVIKDYQQVGAGPGAASSFDARFFAIDYSDMGRISLRTETRHGGDRAQGLGIVVLCPFRSCWAESEGGQSPGGVSGVVAAGGGDAGVPGHFQDPDGEVAQGGHDLGAAAGADLGGVFAVADVADVVQRFDLPVAADPGGELGGGGLAGVQAGDRVDGDGAPLLRRPGAGSGG